MSGFIPIPDEAALEGLFAPSRPTPVVLFLHDPFCSGSARAERELVQLAQPVHFVDVSVQRVLSRLVAERTGVGHESPQAFVLHAGQVVWSRSHGAITTDAVRQALRATEVSVGMATE